MKSFALSLSIALAGAAGAHATPLGVAAGLPAPALVTPVHGCHGTYAHDVRGWHRHGKHCEAQRGLARSKRDRKRAI